MLRMTLVAVVAGMALAPTPSAAKAAPAAAWAQEPAPSSGLASFLPPAPAGWESYGAPEVTENLNGMEPTVSHGYHKIGGPAFMSIVITRPSPEDLADEYSALQLGPHPIATHMVTSLEKVGDRDAYLIHNTAGGDAGYVMMMKVGRVSVGINGADASTKAEIVALAASMDLEALAKY